MLGRFEKRWQLTLARYSCRIVITLLTDVVVSVTRQKSPNVHKSCPKMISLGKLKILAHTQNLPKTVGDLGKLIVAKGFKKLPKVQK